MANVQDTDLAGTGAGQGAAMVGFIQTGSGAAARTAMTKLRDSKSIFDYVPASEVELIRSRTSTADLSSYFEAAFDSMPDGGDLEVPAGRYHIYEAAVSNSNIRLVLTAGTELRRHHITENAPERSIFLCDGLRSFVIDCNGATIDLNGEGPLGIDVQGRFDNEYTSHTVAGVYGIAGPANAFIYARRCSGIQVKGPFTVKNSGENAFLFRNCAACVVRDGIIENIANYGVEFNYIPAASDGSSAVMPAALGGNEVSRCTFRDINDFALGTGNGVGVGGGGGGARDLDPNDPNNPIYAHDLGPIRGDKVLSNTFERCLRDILFEIPHPPEPGHVGTTLVAGQIAGNTSYDTGQTSVALIGCVDWDIPDHRAFDPSAAIAPVLGPNWPTSAGILISDRCERIRLGDGIRIIENHGLKANKGTDGVVTSGQRGTLTSATANFTSAYIGQKIGIMGAGPEATDSSGNYVHHEATITGVPNSTTVTFDPPARRAVSGVTYAYGRACRVGISITYAESVDKISGIVRAGTHSGLSNEPSDAAAVLIKNVSQRAKLEGLTAVAPSNAGSKPAGIRIDTTTSMDGYLLFDPRTVHVSGYAKALAGFYDYRLRVVNPAKSLNQDRTISPNSGNTTQFGTAEVIYPLVGAFLTDILRGSLEAVGTFAAGEQITFRLQVLYDDEDGTPVEVQATAAGVQQLSAKTIKALNPEHAYFRAISVSMKSSVGGSAVTGKVNLIAGQ